MLDSNSATLTLTSQLWRIEVRWLVVVVVVVVAQAEEAEGVELLPTT